MSSTIPTPINLQGNV